VRNTAQQNSAIARLQLFSRLATGTVIALAAVILLGWTLGLRQLIRLFPVPFVMNPITALAFILMGISLLRRRFNQNNAGIDWLAVAPALLAGLFGLLKIADYFFSFNWQVEEFLFPGRVSATSLYPPSEIAPNTALGFVFCSLALLMIDLEPAPAVRPAQGLIIGVALLSLLALIGYGYRMILLYRIGSAEPMSLETALAFSLFSAGFLGARPEKGLMSIVTSNTVGGVVARRLLPTAIIVPWLLGAMLLLGERLGYYERAFAFSFFAVASIVTFTVLIWWNAKLLYVGDLQRVRVERHAIAQHSCTRVLAEASSLADATLGILSSLGENLRWSYGAFWLTDNESGTMRLVGTWSAGQLPDFDEATRTMKGTRDSGFPGRVWAAGTPVWIEDIHMDSNMSRREAALKSGLHSAIGVPVRAGQQIFGVLEFFKTEIESADHPLMDLLAGVGSQIGLFMERIRADERLREMTANLARSNSDLEQFASVASHDLQEPLRMVASYLELLRGHVQKKLEKKELEFLGFALEGARRMAALINDLLAYSRLELRAQPFEPTDLGQALQGALSNLKVAIEEAKASIVQSPMPQVCGDAIQLTQVFQNLLGNALKFRGTEPPHIDVTATRRDKEWVFSVRDNGIGINPKDFERIFVIFQRLHTRQQYAGTGMGLAITKKIIERHGGRIWVESQPGKGSNFLFTLPVLEQTA